VVQEGLQALLAREDLMEHLALQVLMGSEVRLVVLEARDLMVLREVQDQQVQMGGWNIIWMKNLAHLRMADGFNMINRIV
jgi:hypothetical protein